MPTSDDRPSTPARSRGFFARWWWLIAFGLLVLPAALLVWIVSSTPDVQPFSYPVH